MDQTDATARLKNALASWQSWPSHLDLKEEPTLLNGLSSGSSNTAFLVDCGGDLVVARIKSDPVTALELPAAVEWHAHSKAHAAGISPEPLLLSLDDRLFISRYVVEDASDAADSPQAIASLLTKIHELEPIDFELNLGQRCDEYRRVATPLAPMVCSELEALYPQIEAIFDEAAELCLAKCLCHNDMLRGNRLLTRDGILAIDWEYAAMGDPYFDLAVITQGDGLDKEQRTHLLECYGGHDDLASRRLELNETLYMYTELLWLLAVGEMDDHSAIPRLAALLDRL